MTTEQKSGAWIEKFVLKEMGYDLMMALGAGDYHEYAFHEEEMIADGTLKAGEGFARHRREFIDSFESNYPELASKLKTEHDKLPPHKLNARK